MKKLALILVAVCAMASEMERTPLDQVEHDQFVLSMVNWYRARVALLEALAEKRAGNEQVTMANQATKEMQEFEAKMQKKHNAVGCGWNIQQKEWVCEK